MKFESNAKLTYEFPNDFHIQFNIALKQNNVKGKLVYEYNPFRNYRLNEDKIEYNNLLYTKEELIALGLSNSEIENLPKFDKGMLVDFDTDELDFDLEHPVDILCQPSYDNSVNLIIDDDKNIPRLINSRFSSTGLNTYEVIDRKGTNDTNIYDQGDEFEIDTSLYKRVNTIPKLKFNGVLEYGNMKVGNYHFYFKFSDADGNETDFISESGLVSLYMGTLNDPYGIRGGIQNENTHKSVSFKLKDVDSAYDYVVVYYTRNTSDVDGNVITNAFKVDKKYLVTGDYSDIIVDGFETHISISVEDINIKYNIVDTVATQVTCQNRLFLGNVNKPKLPYKELSDIALRIKSEVVTSNNIGELDQNYRDVGNYKIEERGMYYNPLNIYNRLGYWNNEIYRFGVVFIMQDNTVSPVFNIRGHKSLGENSTMSDISFYEKIKDDGPDTPDNLRRNYITYKEDDFKIVVDNKTGEVSGNENAKGVIKLNCKDLNVNTTIGVKFRMDEESYNHVKKYIKGLFFVRQKRIPNILGQGLVIGKERVSSLPVIPINPDIYTSYIKEQDKNNVSKYKDGCYIIERFLDDKRILNQNFEDRLMFLHKSEVDNQALICPEYETNQAKFNNLFTGVNFNLKQSDITPSKSYFELDVNNNTRHFYIDQYTKQSEDNQMVVSLMSVPDNIKMLTHKNIKYSARAGEAEEGFRKSFVKEEQKTNKEANNLVRGSFGSYVGTDELANMKMYDIYIPGYNDNNIDEYFKIRYGDESPYFPVSDKWSIEDYNNLGLTCYRGDCFICNFTHRMNRNFQDLAAPNNDVIIEDDTWKRYYDPTNKEKLVDINTGDVNAVKLGHWVTFTVRSNNNLSLRDTDKTLPSEEGLTGLTRSFYPLQDMSVDGNFKIPESQYLNNGLNITTSNRYNFELPDVPYIKNNFNTRILYSDIHINDAFENGFRVFKDINFRDYPKTYGSLIKLEEMAGNLVCVFEHAIGLIKINEKTAISTGGDDPIYIANPDVMSATPIIISDMLGTQWKDSVLKTRAGIYGVDTVAKKIWKFDGKKLDILSDFKCQQFLNQNITLKERDLTPTIGIRNVKTHYNAYKNDVMFTFYDNLYGIQETVWNLCWNELMGSWQTFYSWVPSFSENIDNLPFTFNRDVSKWIAKIGYSSKKSNLSHGVILDNNVFNNGPEGLESILSIKDRELPEIKGNSDIKYRLEFKLERDGYNAYRKFEVVQLTDAETKTKGIEVKDSRFNPFVLRFKGTYEELTKKPCWLINVSCDVILEDYSGNDTTIKDYIDGWKNYQDINSKYYQNTLGVTAKDVLFNPMITDEQKYDIANLTTDFWKHGQSGIIDIKDDIKPTMWYGKQHPFEIEFVVNDNPGLHKIFNNLQIISNAAEPESFHYEVVGDALTISDDKPNMYIRQEIAKSLYQFNGSSIEYNPNYLKVQSNQNPKSIVCPLYYGREKDVNEVESYYRRKRAEGFNYAHLAGTEIVYDKVLNEFAFWTHAEACDIKDPDFRRLRGNMNYQEDCWDIQINPINFVERNESKWDTYKMYDKNNRLINEINKVPISLYNIPILKEFEDIPLSIDTSKPESEYFPLQLLKRGYTYNDIDLFDWNYKRKEARQRDKFIKIRIRYKGDKLAVITAIKTLYTISYA